jgi:hypothetical protein
MPHVIVGSENTGLVEISYKTTAWACLAKAVPGGLLQPPDLRREARQRLPSHLRPHDPRIH